MKKTVMLPLFHVKPLDTDFWRRRRKPPHGRRVGDTHSGVLSGFLATVEALHWVSSSGSGESKATGLRPGNSPGMKLGLPIWLGSRAPGGHLLLPCESGVGCHWRASSLRWEVSL